MGYWWSSKYEVTNAIRKFILENEKIMSKEKSFVNSFAHHPIIQIKLEIDLNTKLDLYGVIDTGSTFTIVSETIVKEYYDISTLESQALRTIDGQSKVYNMKKKMLVQIPNYHDTDRGFNIPIYSGKLPKKDENDEVQIDVILGLSFLEKCSSFWIDAQNKTFELKFWN